MTEARVKERRSLAAATEELELGVVSAGDGTAVALGGAIAPKDRGAGGGGIEAGGAGGAGDGDVIDVPIRTDAQTEPHLTRDAVGHRARGVIGPARSE